MREDGDLELYGRQAAERVTGHQPAHRPEEAQPHVAVRVAA